MTALLLDTHVFLWWREDSARLSDVCRFAIATADCVHVSLASAWECAIKASLGRLRLPEAFETGVRASHFTPLPIAFAHTEALVSLPLHHRDPFDRMLVAQAVCEGLTLVTHDKQLRSYPVPILWI